MGDGFEEDAADREARRKAAAEAARLAELRKRSNVMQRELPRPASLELLPEARPDAQVRRTGWGTRLAGGLAGRAWGRLAGSQDQLGGVGLSVQRRGMPS